jgi:hypothetical protein
MDRNLKRALLHFAIALTALWIWMILQGCASFDRSIHKVATVTFEIHVVGNRTMYDWPKARQDNGPGMQTVGGYAKNTNPPQIWLTGYRDERGVQVDNIETLGHEIMEVLRFSDRDFSNPHK